MTFVGTVQKSTCTFNSLFLLKTAQQCHEGDFEIGHNYTSWPLLCNPPPLTNFIKERWELCAKVCQLFDWLLPNNNMVVIFHLPSFVLPNCLIGCFNTIWISHLPWSVSVSPCTAASCRSTSASLWFGSCTPAQLLDTLFQFLRLPLKGFLSQTNKKAICVFIWSNSSIL